jgi:hypothetical protein
MVTLHLYRDCLFEKVSRHRSSGFTEWTDDYTLNIGFSFCLRSIGVQQPSVKRRDFSRFSVDFEDVNGY